MSFRRICYFCVFVTFHAGLVVSQGSSSTSPSAIPPMGFDSPSQTVIASQMQSTKPALPSLTTSIMNNTSITHAAQSSKAISATPTITTSKSTPSATIHTKSTTPRPQEKDDGRKFDGLSFFGGIVLGAAIVIVLLLGVKYYQAKKRSYHSL